MKDETDEVPVVILKETDKAFQLKNEEGKIDWFPYSQISFKKKNLITKEAIAEIPMWLLNAKGWNE